LLGTNIHIQIMTKVVKVQVFWLKVLMLMRNLITGFQWRRQMGAIKGGGKAGRGANAPPQFLFCPPCFLERL
jgi:hypothetical protein